MSLSVAFIGLGNMGRPMAVNLTTAGYTVTGYDLFEGARDAASEAGVTIAASAADAVATADVVITMLQNGKQVLDAYSGADGEPGFLATARPGTLFVDCSTISVTDAVEAHRRAVEAGHRNIDSPVSGGVVGATAGTLAMMVGGDEADFAAAAPVLEVVGGRIVHCGAAGAGQAAKVCNNMILAVSMIAVSEAFVLGESLGLTDQALYDVASNASGQCWALTTNCPVPGPVPTSPANRDYQPGFSSALMTKDLGLAVEALKSTGVTAELGSMAQTIFKDFSDDGGAGLDFSAIITRIRSRSTAA